MEISGVYLSIPYPKENKVGLLLEAKDGREMPVFSANHD